MNVKFMTPEAYKLSRINFTNQYVALDEGLNKCKLIYGGMVIGFITKDGKVKRHKEYPYKIEIVEPSANFIASISKAEEVEVKEIDEWDTIVYEEEEEENEK